MELLSGHEWSAQIRERLQQENERDGITPVLAIVNVGDDKTNLLYIGLKQKAMSDIGGRVEAVMLERKTTREDLLQQIERLNRDAGIHGILLQLPLPPELEPAREDFLAAIRPDKDVDGFTPYNRGLLLGGEPLFVSCIAQAAFTVIERCRGSAAGLRALLAGDSWDLIQPLALLLLRAGAETTIIPAWQDDAYEAYDVVVVEKGGCHCVRPEQLAADCLLIDNGYYSDRAGKLCGNVDKALLLNSGLKGWLMPNPGGLGPLLITQLVSFVHQAARLNRV